MKQERLSKLKEGQLVTLIEPVAIPSVSSIFEAPRYDYAFVGKKLLVKGVINGIVYLEDEKGNLISLFEHKYRNKWAEYIEPKFKTC